MIRNFLTGIWKRGGLTGAAVSDDAFSLHAGLGETMTPEDILEGIPRVTILVAVTRRIGLADFRDLEPGTRLAFPPLR